MTQLVEIKLAPANKVDDVILRYIDSHSPEEISRRLHGAVSPAAVRLRGQELVQAVDWLTEAEQDKVVVLKMRRVLAELEGKHLDVDNARLRLQYLKEIGARLEKRRRATDEDLNTYSVNIGLTLGNALSLVLAFMRGRILHLLDSVLAAPIERALRRYVPAETLGEAVSEVRGEIVNELRGARFLAGWDADAKDGLREAQAEIMKKAIEA